jgi:PAS domain-containing protein
MTTLKSRISIPQGVLFCDLATEAVVLNQRTGKYFGLDDVGARTWQLLTQHRELEAVYRALLLEYDVAAERLQQDLLAFIHELDSHQLLDVHPA